MASGEGSGLADLEKELTCSICTELLYQPLTLLDCLHTFCGACLKEWFQFQASTATSIHPYTCPSCRATVVKTQRNASVTTLLDVFQKASPDSGKSEEDKKADREKYKHGDNVLPKLRRRDDPAAEEDRRLLEEVQQLSLREAGIPGSSNSLEPPRERRRRTDRSRDGSRSSRNSGREGRGQVAPGGPSREIIPPRHVEHQSSLRSLLSASELDSQEMEEEIMRQIMEEGLLDGIDLENIDTTQEDQITERIAQAYRARQEQRRQQRRERRERMAREGRLDLSASGTATPQDVETPPLLRGEERPRRRPHGRSESGASTPVGPGSRPPVSRPAMIDAANHGARASHRRSSSQGSSRSARRAERPAALAVTSTRQAASSASELGQRPSASEAIPPARRRQSDNQQGSTLEERRQFRNSLSLQVHPASNPNSPRRLGFTIPTTESPPSTTSPLSLATVPPPARTPPAPPTAAAQPPTSRRTTDPTSVRQTRLMNNSTPPLLSPSTYSQPRTESPAAESAHSVLPTATPVLYPEPAISCDRCAKEHIEYEVHYNCSRCDEGDYNLCLSCYRASKGCKHWYGFGWAAWHRYERQAPPGGYPLDHEHPHILIGRRYRRPSTPLKESLSSSHTLQFEEDPSQRLESGVFCDTCNAFANDCYWKCDICNEGAWGYCNDCVNQGRHCTHPLLPLAHTPQASPPYPTDEQPPPPGRTLSAPKISESSSITPPYPPDSPTLPPTPTPDLIPLANSTFRPLTFTTLCNKCSYPIPPSHTRYHCLKCNKGDYDLCTSCYHKLVASGRVSKEDGPNGWRRCPRGHRMVVVGFEDRETGHRRIVARDLVGGLALRDVGEEKEAAGLGGDEGVGLGISATWRDTDGSVHKYRTPNPNPNPSSSGNSALRFPPDGGVGLRVQATWSYFPEEGVSDELGFPRKAEITEAEDVNGDWFWGVYAGSKGLFPGNYGRVVGGREESGRMI